MNKSLLFFDGDICGERGVLLLDGEEAVFVDKVLLGKEKLSSFGRWLSWWNLLSKLHYGYY